MGDVAPVERLGDRYALYGEIAAGGMATVHFGRLLGPVGFSRTVAIKRLHAQLAREAEFVSMFLDEARLAARVRHPNVVATIDVIETVEQICLVMEYVQGESLWRLARAATERGGRVPRRIVVSVICGMLHGLHAAHEAKNERGEPLGIVHRDVSPQNVLVGVDGVPRVIDFGIAKAVGRLHTTGEGKVKGKFAYMSPEQLLDGEISRLTDIYAASVLLWELLTGQRLFEAESQGATVQKVLAGVVPRPSAIVPSLVPALDEIVLRGVALNPLERFQTARDMARAIEECVAPASPTEVGEWVEKMAGDRLRSSEARLKEIEDSSSGVMALPASPGGPGTPVSAVNSTASRVIAGMLPTSPSLPVTRVENAPQRDDVPDLDLRRAAFSPMSQEPDLATLKDNTLPSGIAATAPVSNRDVEFDAFGEEGPGAPIDLDVAVPTGAARAGSLAPRQRAIERAEAGAADRRSFPWGRLLTLLVLSALAGFAIMLVRTGPEYAKRRATQAAARQGIELSIDQVTFHWRTVLLTGVKASPRDVPALGATAEEVEIALAGLETRGITVRNFELTAHGTIADVTAQVRVWHENSAEPLRLDAQSGHVIWDDALGSGTQLEAWDVSAELAPTARDEAHIKAPNLVIRTGHGNFGPWDSTYERKDEGSRLSMSLNPLAPDSATVQLVRPSKGSGSLTIAVPRSPMSRVGVAPESFGLVADAEMEARVVGTASQDHADGQATLTFYGARLASAPPTTGAPSGGRGPVDLRIEASVAGDPAAPLPLLNPALTIGGVKSRLAGTLTLVDAGFRVELAQKPAPATKGTPPPPPPPVLVIDSRNMTARDAKP